MKPPDNPSGFLNVVTGGHFGGFHLLDLFQNMNSSITEGCPYCYNMVAGLPRIVEQCLQTTGSN